MFGYFTTLCMKGLIKVETYFKGQSLCIDLTLTNKKYCSKNTTIFETGLSDHHHFNLFNAENNVIKKRNQNKLPMTDIELLNRVFSKHFGICS